MRIHGLSGGWGGGKWGVSHLHCWLEFLEVCEETEVWRWHYRMCASKSAQAVHSTGPPPHIPRTHTTVGCA